MKDNYISSKLKDKLMISPRGLSNADTNLYSSVSTKKNTSNSLTFNQGVLRDSANIVDRLASHNCKTQIF